MNKLIKRGLSVTCLLTLLANLTACGYFLYPERKGQTGGRIDPVVLILDAAGLLFGVLPGVVAFAVDFTNGTIYLPAGGSSAIDRHLSQADQQDAKQVIDQNGQVWLQLPLNKIAGDAQDMQQVTSALRGYTGQQVQLQDIVWLEDMAALRNALAEQHATAAR